METRSWGCSAPWGATLETFLGGMETRRAVCWSPKLGFLETFLGGMETDYHAHFNGSPPRPLKPSLVEWKQLGAVQGAVVANTLETFLGGMETPPHRAAPMPSARLETFLGGMETLPR